MEDKIFEFMERMYADLKSEIKSVKSELKSEIQSVNNHVIKLEQEHGAKLDALLDGYKQLSEGQEEIKCQLADIQKKVARHENEISYLKAVK